ncbi:MAG: HAD family hydrolase [Planctomycetota bacterium]|nr:HAD family hydrolase [Planctomycetota bacterium]
MSGVPGLFLDRDGVLNHFLIDSVRTIEQFQYYEFTAEAMERLGCLGYPIVVVTNQSAIGRGWTSEEQVQSIHQQLIEDCSDWGASIASVEYCPHLPDAGCECRKPGPGMFLRAARDHGIDLDRSVMVGDSSCDIEAAQRLGMARVRVRTGRGDPPLTEGLEADAWVENLNEAAVWIEEWCR